MTWAPCKERFSDAEGRVAWVGSMFHTHSAEFLAAFCRQWAESRSFSLFSVGSHPLRCLVVQTGWGTIAAVWFESPP